MKQSSNFGLDVLVHGSSAKQYFHDSKFYVEGRQGSEFTVSLSNNTGKRVLAVLTVDGLSVIDGKDGSFKSQGYILDPWQLVKVPGWRLNDKKVAAFEFTRSDKSYASSKGKGINSGVIGCAFYYEKEWPTVTLTKSPDYWPFKPKQEPWVPNGSGHSPHWYSSSGSTGMNVNTSNSYAAQSTGTSSSFSLPLSVRSGSLGTGFGEEKQHKVIKSGFERSSDAPAEILTVYYDSGEGLTKRGIDLSGNIEIASPFPKEDLNGYCKPPVGWNS